MKIRITFKDPDGVWECVDEAAREQLNAINGLDGNEREKLIESRRDGLFEQLQKWLAYNEYVDIEFDLDGGTATVLPAK